MKNIACYLLFFLTVTGVTAQQDKSDSTSLDYGKIYGLALDGNILPALDLLKSADTGKLSAKDAAFINDFKNRFAYSEDKSNYISNAKLPITELLGIYRDYWRNSMLGGSQKEDTILLQNLQSFFKKNSGAKNKPSSPGEEENNLKEYLTSLGLFTTGFGRTGRFADLLVWKKQRDTVYRFSVQGEIISAKVVFMNDFITLGWEQYATLGKHYPGGWATKEALFCVEKAYDLNSEDFRISYLAHESRHFADYKLFPKLCSTDLEYRAKLTELSLLKTDMYSTLSFFINNANYQSDNDHSVADFCVVRDLSQALFHTAFEKDIDKWKAAGIEKINQSSLVLLQENSRNLSRLGKDVQRFIKN